MPLPEIEAKQLLERLGIPKEDWVSPKVEIKESPLGGKGMYAKEDIEEGETVIIWGGTPSTLFTEEDIKAGKARRGSVAAIDEGLYLAGSADEEAAITDFTNHSCDSNLWMKDAVTLIARKGIKSGEEITADYALWQSDEDWSASWECNCGTAVCRRKITGRDWRVPDVQERYQGHFSPFLNKRIGQLQEIH